MPTFTMELWRVIELKSDAVPEDEWLGLSEYPLFDPEYRESLNRKIKDHFMYQEIGHETVAQFRFAMKRKMNEIMPLYNDLYKSTQLQFDPLSTVNIKTLNTSQESQTAEGSTLNESDSDTTAKSKNVASTFPQVQLAGDKDYATNGADANSQTTASGKVDEKSTSQNEAESNSESSTMGYQGIPAQLIQAYRASLINVDLLIIGELDELFMLTWGNSDSYTQTRERRFY